MAKGRRNTGRKAKVARNPNWGGVRPGAGIRKKPVEPVPAEPVAKRPPNFTELMSAYVASVNARPRAREWCPYVIDPLKQHPPGAVPPVTMAMDNALTTSNSWAIDAWMNGSMMDNMTSEGLLFLGYPYLSELAQRPEFRIMSETLATEMTRKWVRFKAASEDEDKSDRIKELTDFLDDLHVRDAFTTAALHDGWFGRSHLYLDCGGVADAELSMPVADPKGKLLRGKIGKKWLKGIKSIEPMWAYPQNYNATDPLKPDWYDPQIWYVMGKAIHRSRLLTFIGRPVPDLLRPAYSFGGLSLSQMAKPYVDIWLKTRASVAEIVRSFSVMVLKTDMAAAIQPQGTMGMDLMARVALFNSTRDNQGTMVIDKNNEDFSNVSASLAGLHELQAQSQEHMMSVARIPAVKFTGMQPSGLNASSEGEIRAFYDSVNAYQPMLFGRALNIVIDAAMVTLWGETDPAIVYEWVPLWSLSEKEEAEVREVNARADTTYADAGVLDPVEIRSRLANDPNSIYPGLDPEDLPEPPVDPNNPDDPGNEGGGGPPGPGGPGSGGGERDGGEDPEDKAKEAAKAKPEAEDSDAPFFKPAPAPAGADEQGWQEGQHPRKADGKFAPKGAGEAGAGGGKAPKQYKNAKGGGGSYSNLPAKYADRLSAMLDGVMAKPIKQGALKKIGAKMGSNEGGTFEDKKTGEKFYMKKPPSAKHVANELAAANLYKLAGVNTLTYVPVDGGNAIATKLEKLDVDNVKKLSPAERQQARKNFITHAWLANWDAVGTGGDNIGVLNGKVTTLDTGGSLEYRAQGEPKGEAFGNDPTKDILTMVDESKSPDAAALFKDMTPEEAKASALQVVEIPDEAIREAVYMSGGSDALADKLIARKEKIAELYDLQPSNPDFEAKHKRDATGKFVALSETEVKALENSPSAIELIIKDIEKNVEDSYPAVKEVAEAWVAKYPAIAPALSQALSAQAYKAMAKEISAKAMAKPAAAKVLFGGAWKNGGANEQEALKINVASVMSKPATHGQNFRKMLAFMVKQAKKFGGEFAEAIPGLKAKMVEATLLAKAKAEGVGDTAAIDKLNAALGEMYEDADAFSAGTAAFKAGQGGAAPAAAPVKPSPATSNPVEKQEAKPAKPAQSEQEKDEAGVQKFAPAFYEKAKELDASGYDALKKGKYKIKNAVLLGATLDAAKVMMKPDEQAAVAKQYGSVEGAFAKSQEYKQKADAAESAAIAAAEKAKQKEAEKEKSEAEEEAKFFAENPGAEMHTKAMQGVLGKKEQFAYMQNVASKLASSKALKDKIAPHEAVSIVAYSGAYYKTLNNQMRDGVMTPQQWQFAKSLNAALDKLPNYTGVVGRKANLPAEVFAKYKVGMVIEERAFTSTSTSQSVWSGSHTYEIHSKTGKHIQALSSHPSEHEVLFKSGSRFLVKSITGTHIVMEEV